MLSRDHNILWLPESNGYPTRTILCATLRRVAGRVARGHQRAGQGQLTPKPSGPDRRHAPSEITIGLIILLLVVLVASTITLFLSESEDRWTCTVYPDKRQLSVSVTLGEHSSLQECGVAARSAIEAAGWSDADYECGLNCKPWSEAAQAGFDLLVCEDTVGPSLFDP